MCGECARGGPGEPKVPHMPGWPAGRLKVKGNGLDTPHTGFVTITFSINQNTFTMYDAS